MDDKDNLDRIIDEGVRQYMDAEPPLGLENRVLAALEQKRTQPAWWQRRWLIAVPALAALVLVVAIGFQFSWVDVWPTQNVAKKVVQPPPTVTPPPVVPAVVAKSTAPNRPARAVKVAMTPLPTPQQFPSPTAASEQERILAQLIRQGRTPVAVAENHPAPGKDVPAELVQISAVQVQPLPDPNNGQ